MPLFEYGCFGHGRQFEAFMGLMAMVQAVQPLGKAAA